MKDIAVEILLEKISSLYKLTNIASMRATEISNGMKKLVDSEPKAKATTIAIKEIAEGKVTLKAQ